MKYIQEIFFKVHMMTVVNQILQDQTKTKLYFLKFRELKKQIEERLVGKIEKLERHI